MPRTKKQFKEMREKTHSLIVETALKLFAEKGYHGTSISDIAKEANISKGLAYNYFESKKHIAIAILDQLNETGKYFENLIDKEDDPYKVLKILINDTFKYVKENEEYWRLYLGFSMQPDVLDLVKTQTNEFNARIVKRIENVFKKIGMKDAYIEARYFGSILDGMAFSYFFDKENFPIDKFRKLMLKRYSKAGLDLLHN